MTALAATASAFRRSLTRHRHQLACHLTPSRAFCSVESPASVLRHQQQQQHAATSPTSAAPDGPPLSGDAHQEHRLAVFAEEFERQRKRAKRTVDKIEVVYTAADGQAHSLFMNKGVSTPMDAAKHLSEELCSESVLAMVNNTTWDMHRPLNASCSIAFLNFKTPTSKEEADAIRLCNVALWRSGSLIMGSVFETAFRDDFAVKLISFPPPFIKSGSFVYDCQVSRRQKPLTWNPSKAELRALSLAAERFVAADHAFEPMDAPGTVALEMFKHNDCKLAAIRSILEARPDNQVVTVYRVGSFVDLSSGPMISRTGLVGRFAVSAIHQVEAPDFGQLMRVQGMAVPRAFLTHFSSLELLERRAAVLNRAFLPTKPGAGKRGAPVTPSPGAGAEASDK